ncbi:MAG: GNAT family N-acetyltransferase [Clostridia bacterium]|nr:GNAT family N-acetyltransferase [Clostridia bacterium]
MQIRLTTASDLDRVMEIYAKARAFMAENGNPTQWGTDRPTRAQIEADIELGQSYVCAEDDEILAVFCFYVGDDPAYHTLEGVWLNDRPYGVVHRIATGGARRGAAAFCLDWCFEKCGNVRIDTHVNNKPMQRLVGKKGFQFCGICHVSDGTERLAFQKS